MEDDATLDETASVEEQPVQEAVSDETQVDTTATDTTTEASVPEQPSTSARSWAGKYQSPEELERAYLEAQREASRMAGELSVLKKTPQATASATEPKWKQLDGERQKWAQALRNAQTDQERWQADEQVRLYDREIAYERARYEFETVSTRRSAEQQLESDSQTIIKQYEADLNNMSSPLYQAAASRFEALTRAGYPDNNATKALAVAYAAVTTGQGAKQAVQQDRGQLLKQLNTQAKRAVQAGAGGPAAVKSGAITAKDIENMSDKEFAAYERRLQGV